MPEVLDGRTARRERNRNAVIEAAMSLLEEGEADPSVEDITRRSGVSARSIFRYFESLDELRRAVLKRTLQRMAPLLQIPELGQGDFDSRVRRFVAARVRFCEGVSTVGRMARARATFAPLAAEAIAQVRSVLDQQIRIHFAAELAGRSPEATEQLLALIGVLASFEAWDLMTGYHGRSQEQIGEALTTALYALLSPTADVTARPGPTGAGAERPPSG